MFVIKTGIGGQNRIMAIDFHQFRKLFRNMDLANCKGGRQNWPFKFTSHNLISNSKIQIRAI